MSIFPAQYSTLSPSALKNYIIENYGFSDLSCRLLIRNVSDTYILENLNEQYIFKIYRDSHRKLEEIKGEVELLNNLKDNKVCVSHPIQNLKGDYLSSFNAIEGTRYGVLFSYAAGSVAINLNPNQLELLGKEMAHFHQISSKITLQHLRKEYNIETTLKAPFANLKPSFIDLADEYAQLSELCEHSVLALQHLQTSSFSTGYCHYDFLPKNFHFNGNHQLTFFDFDFAGKGFLLNDITTFLIHYFLDVTYHKMSNEEALNCFNVFLNSYKQNKMVSDEELKAIPYLGIGFWVFYLNFQYENYDDWSNLFFTPRFIKDRVSLIQKWLDWSKESLASLV
ncbi:MAG: phosphotransferase [Pelobium sp.]